MPIIASNEELRLLKHMHAVRKHFHLISFIKNEIHEGRADSAKEAFSELDNDDQRALYRAPSKGGVWTTAERHAIKFGEIK